jgi:uncharacterized protein (TIGR02391 family)
MSESEQFARLPAVIKYEDGASGYECGFCGGSGVWPETAYDDDAPGEPCPVCGGVGFNVFSSASEGVVPCRCCGGDGKRADDGYFMGGTCPVCQGRGVVDLVVVKREQLANNPEALWVHLHPAVVEVARARFNDGHYADSVEAAFKAFNSAVKQRVRGRVADSCDGAPLMQKAFSAQDPLLILEDMTTQSGRNVQLGYMQMFSGAMTGIRNPKAHDNVTIDASRAIHLLFVASLFFYRLDDVQPGGI